MSTRTASEALAQTTPEGLLRAAYSLTHVIEAGTREAQEDARAKRDLITAELLRRLGTTATLTAVEEDLVERGGHLYCPHCHDRIEGDDALIEDDRCERENYGTVTGVWIHVHQHDADFETVGWRHPTCGGQVRVTTGKVRWS